MAGDHDPTRRPEDETAPLRPVGGTPFHARRVSPGDTIAGRYRVLRRIGSGGMGEVFEATDTQLERVIALKLVGPVIDDLDADAMLSEARKAARLRHAHIAGVHDAGMVRIGDETMAYIAMEIVPGAERIDAWARRTDADLSRRLHALADVCDAMAHAHVRGVVHGDLKPGNILIDADGGPRVIDFGVSRALGVDEPLQASRGGTPGYAAPEQQSPNAPPLDGRVDVFAIGVLTRELTADVPIAPSASRDLSRVIAAATRDQRDERIGDAATLGENLRAIAESRVAPIAIDGPIPRAARVVRASASRSAWAWVVASALIGIGVSMWVGAPVIHRWTHLNRWPTTALSAVPRIGGFGDPLDRVRVVLLRDDDDIQALAALEGLTDVRERDLRSWRRLHGRMMERLAEARPRAIVWDIRFAGESAFDPDLVRGIRAVEDAGAGVAVAATDWTLDATGLPNITRPVLEVAGWGVASGVHNAIDPWRVDIAVLRTDERDTLNSLTLQALAAAECADCEIDAALDPDTGIVQIRVWRPTPGIAAGRAWFGGQRPIRLTSVERIERDNLAVGVRTGDRVGVLMIDVPPDETLDQATVSYSDIFRLPPRELRERIAGRIVIVGNIRNGRDLHPHPSGRMLPGPWAHACAIDALERGGAVRLPTPAFDGVLATIFAVGAALCGIAGSGRWRSRLVFLACLTACCAAATIALYAWKGLMVNTMVQALGAIAAWELAAWAARLRRT